MIAYDCLSKCYEHRDYMMTYNMLLTYTVHESI